MTENKINCEMKGIPHLVFDQSTLIKYQYVSFWLREDLEDGVFFISEYVLQDKKRLFDNLIRIIAGVFD